MSINTPFCNELCLLPSQVLKAKPSSTSWAPTDLFLTQGIHKLPPPLMNSQRSNLKTQACIKPFQLIHIDTHIDSPPCLSWNLYKLRILKKSHLEWEQSKISALFVCFVFVGWFCSKRGNADYVKGAHGSDKASELHYRNPADNNILFTIIQNTNEFSQGQLPLLEKKAELT